MGRATSSLLLTSRGSFRVATTVPTMRARIMTGGSGLRFRRGRLADRQRVLEVGVRPRDDVHRNELTNAARRGGSGVGGGLHSSDIAAHDGGDVAGANL